MTRLLIVTLTVELLALGTAFITWAITPRYAWPLWIYTAGVGWWFIRQLDTKEPA